MHFSSAPRDHARLIMHMKSSHGGYSHAHSLGNVHSQAKEIIHNVNRYFIAGKTNKDTFVHRKFEIYT